ncbi:slender lobes [Musca autumnalis]|uniref:slender lobes n=1 Tax=Musca autumnalis TaxID=221902 RepID=UPI003CF21B71
MDTATESGGRGTRVLRKRLTSIDSDNSSSRPGTPVQSKITASAKVSTDSPLKPRMTRRNSTSGVATPVKTPAKRGTAISTITETDAKTASSPARRTTRRRSTSSSVENDGPLQPMGSKVPNFDTLSEEQETAQGRVTRSKSKSPPQVKPTTSAASRVPTSTRKSLRVSVVRMENEIVEKSGVKNKSTPQKSSAASVPKDKQMTLAKKSTDIEQQENIDPLAEKQETAVINRNKEKSEKSENKQQEQSEETALEENKEKKQSEEAALAENKEKKLSEETALSENKEKKQADGTVPPENKEKKQSGEATPLEMEVGETPVANGTEKDEEKNKMEVLENTGTGKDEGEKQNEMEVVETEEADKGEGKNEMEVSGTEDAEKGKEENEMEFVKNTGTEETAIGEKEQPSALQKENDKNVTDSEEIANKKPDKKDIDETKEMETNKEKVPSDESSKPTNEGSSVKNNEGDEQNNTNVESSEANNEESSTPENAAEQNNTIVEPLEVTQEDSPIKTKLDKSCNVLPPEEEEEDPSLIMVPETQETDITKEQNINSEDTNMNEEEEDQSIIMVNETQITGIEKEEANNSKDANEADENDDVDLKLEAPDMHEDDVQTDDKDKAVDKNNTINVSIKDELPDDHEIVSEKGQIDANEDEPMDMDEPEAEDVCKTPSPKKRKSLSKVQIATPMQSSAKPKSVAFNSIGSDDECEKSIYPKTPGSAKSKSFIETDDNSFHGGGDDESVVSVDDASEDEEIPETQPQLDDGPKHKAFSATKEKAIIEPKVEMETEEEEHVEMEQPEDEQQQEHKEEEEKLEEENSTKPSKANTSIRKTATPSKEPKEKKSSSLNSSTVVDESESNLKWCNPSVTNISGTNAKLDTITAEKKETKVVESPQENPKKKKQKYLKRSEWNSDDEDAPADDDDEEEALVDEDEEEDNEAPYRRKHSFHDDEAMVVDDYESGDSMDSEERREMLENEIPVDGESIGSHTTDEEDNGDAEEESENDSFIVSDDEEEDGGGLHEPEDSDANTDSDDEGEEDEEELEVHAKESKKRDKKKTYKRIQRPTDDSSSDDEEEEEQAQGEKQEKLNKKDIENTTKDNEEDVDKNSLNNSKLSDSALRLQCNDDESSSSDHDVDINKSRKEILRKLNRSDRFNKSVRDLDPDVEASPEVDKTAEEDVSHDKQQSSEEDEERQKENSQVSNKKRLEAEEEEENEEEEDDSEAENAQGKNESIHGIRVTSEEEDDGEEDNDDEDTNADDNDEEMADEGDNDDSEIDNEDKENESNKKSSATNKAKHHNRGLSLSFGHFKPQKKDSLQKRVLQRSFTIGVRISGGEVDTAVIEAKPCAEESNASTNPSSSSGNEEETDDTTGGVLSTEDIRYLENFQHMPLGNPLVRTRRQSLALPINPELELCNSSLGINMPAKKPKRKSLAVLSSNEFNPSQSFVHSLELRKAESNQSTKRKRLSKSFCATSEGLDASIIDLDVRHLHKRSKLALDSSLLVDSLENLSSSKANSSKVKHSSTPHEKKKKTGGEAAEKSDTSIKRILNRCDEILEAANRAKLEAKLNYKKSKVRMPKKNKKKTKQRVSSSSPESKHEKPERIFAPLSRDFKRKDKVKRAAAVARALRASANIIIGKPIQVVEEDDSQEENNNNNCKPIMKTENIKGKSKKLKKAPHDDEHLQFRNYTTSAGNVVETLRTPEKKKKPKVIHLPTGKVCVEPLTPTKRTIVTCNGMEFHESPATPYGFNIEFSALDTPQFPMGGGTSNKDRKRKRNIEEKKTFPKPQWTQSGMFVEEEIPGATRSSHFARAALKKQQFSQSSGGYNFKQNALFRTDIKRSSTRELLQLRERRPVHSNY